jgi:hypothetical protein
VRSCASREAAERPLMSTALNSQHECGGPGHCAAIRRASWIGDTDQLCRASDLTFAQLGGTSAGYVHFKRVSGAAAIQSTIAELRAHASAL